MEEGYDKVDPEEIISILEEILRIVKERKVIKLL